MIPKKEFKIGDKVRIIEPPYEQFKGKIYEIGKIGTIVEHSCNEKEWNDIWSKSLGQHDVWLIDGLDIENTSVSRLGPHQVIYVDICLELLESKSNNKDCSCDIMSLMRQGCSCGAFKKEDI